MMTFSEALLHTMQNKVVRREGWNAAGFSLAVQFPDENSANTLPYLFISFPKAPEDGKELTFDRVPFIPSNTDLFSNDWEIVESKLEPETPAQE